MDGFDFEDDTITLSTPEGVGIDLVLAGLGSRFTAMLIDQILISLTLLALSVAVALFSGATAVVVFALATLGWFLTQFGYFILFVVLDQGRSVGKRLLSIRVVRCDGSGIGFLASAIRNVLRIIDSIPGAYLVGIIAVLASKRQQRLGDLAADTVVVRDRRIQQQTALSQTSFDGPPPLHPELAAVAARWDLSGISQADTAAVRAFLGRRFDLPPAARWRLAAQFDLALRPRVPSVPAHLGAEQFLEALAWAKTIRG